MTGPLDFEIILGGLDPASYRVLRRFTGMPWRSPDAPHTLHVGVYVDCETTGLGDDAVVIQYAAARFHYSETPFAIWAVERPLVCYNDPGMPIPPEITALTGITDAMVAGHHLTDRVPEIMAHTDDIGIVVAHHAAFDRPIVERTLPEVEFDRIPWACSHVDVNWSAYGARSSKLRDILEDTCALFTDGHRADADVLAGLHVLTHATRDGHTAFAEMMQGATGQRVLIRASGAPFETKDALRLRGYSWNATARVWGRSIAEADADTERAWLREHAACRAPVITLVRPVDRFTARAD